MAYGETPGKGNTPQNDSGQGAGPVKRKYESHLGESLALAAQFGFSVACPMLAFIGGGAWLDNRLHTMPLLLFVGVVLGLATAAGLIYQVANVQSKQRAGKSTLGAPYKVEGKEEQVGTDRAVYRRRTRR